MSTNSSICMLRKNGKVSSVYCYWDGYVEHNGAILTKYYKDPSKVDELISLGSISSLGEVIIDDIVKKYGFDYQYNPLAKEEYTEEELDDCKSTIAYHRDRGEKLEISNFDSIKDFYSHISTYGTREFTYLYIEEENEWYLLECYKYPKVEINLRKLYFDENEEINVSEDFKYYFLDDLVERYSKGD